MVEEPGFGRLEKGRFCRVVDTCLCDDVQISALSRRFHYTIVMLVFSFSSSASRYSSGIDNQGDFS